MKTRILLLGAGAFALCLPAVAAPVPVKSTITAVTVYTDRAVVTRTATVDLGATGTVEALFDKLPAALIEQSLTVAGHGTGQATILDVTARDVHVDFTPNERVKALEDELREIARQSRGLKDRQSILEAQEASLGRVESAATAPPAKESAPRLTIEESLKLLAFLEEQRARHAEEQQALERKTEEFEAKRTALEKQVASIRGDARRTYKTIVVRLDAASPGQLELAVSYALPGASWTPSYDARAGSNEANVELSYFGRVRQNTGEEWNNVALTLSTARPSLGGAAPEVGTWVVDVARPPAYVTAATTVAAAPSPVVTLNAVSGSFSRTAPYAERAKVAVPAVVAQAAVEIAVTSASFKVTSPATVPSDNSPQKIPITTLRLAATPEYLTTPKRLAAAFLTAKVINSSDFPLLPGAMNVFLDGTFVATSSLKGVMPGEKFDLALGADEGILVKHKRVQRFAEDTGLTNRGRRVTYEYLLTIQNNKKQPARVVVADQVPLSRYERIVVKLIAPTEKDQKPAPDGELKWTLELKPGEKREIPLKFSIEHPNDLPVAGIEA